MNDLSEKDAFKLGFLTRCAEEQLTGDRLTARIKCAAEKRSWFWPLMALGGMGAVGAGLGSGVLGGARNLLSGYGSALGAAGAAGLAGGAGLGYGLARVTAPDITDDEIRAQELAQTYRIYADRARAKNKAKKKYRAAQ